MFAYRTLHPSLLKQAIEPTTGVVPQSEIVEARNVLGRDNDRHIIESVERSERVILAWGNHGTWQKQDLYTLGLLKDHTPLYSLGITKKGCPLHPLYLCSSTKPQIYGSVAL